MILRMGEGSSEERSCGVMNMNWLCGISARRVLFINESSDRKKKRLPLDKKSGAFESLFFLFDVTRARRRRRGETFGEFDELFHGDLAGDLVHEDVELVHDSEGRLHRGADGHLEVEL